MAKVQNLLVVENGNLYIRKNLKQKEWLCLVNTLSKKIELIEKV